MECISIILHPRNASFHKRFKKLPGKPIEFQPSKRQRVHIIDILRLKAHYREERGPSSTFKEFLYKIHCHRLKLVTFKDPQT